MKLYCKSDSKIVVSYYMREINRYRSLCRFCKYGNMIDLYICKKSSIWDRSPLWHCVNFKSIECVPY